jgi:hypothetical protein
MGRRYSAICDYFKIKNIGIDLDDRAEIASNCDKIIIATPTNTHCDMIVKYAKYGKPILCEKPLSKDPDELFDVLKYTKNHAVPVFMVNNYLYSIENDLVKNGTDTVYSYYSSGNDGLIFDCIQLVDMAEDKIVLANASPIWQCEINGAIIRKESIDFSYMRMIDKYLDNDLPLRKTEELTYLHYRAKEAQDEFDRSNSVCHWHSSKDEFNKITQ